MDDPKNGLTILSETVFQPPLRVLACPQNALDSGERCQMTNLRAIALDPGITTGIVTIGLSTTGFPGLEIYQEVDSCYELYQLLEHLRPNQIICEDFEYRSWEKSVELFSVQLIGVANLYTQRIADCISPPYATPPVELVLQKAATGKAFYTDQKIKDLDLWVPGQPHGMDALRHMLYWLTFGSGFQFKDQVNKLGIMIK